MGRQLLRAGGFNRLRFWLIALLILVLIIAIPAFAQSTRAYAWADADLALLNPPGWLAPVATHDGETLTLTLHGGDATMVLAVLPVSASDDNARRAALEARLAALNLLPLQYALDSLYGRGGLRIDAVSADRQQIGIARSGRLPDDRGLLLVGRSSAADQAALEAEFNALLSSLVFSASLPPVRPGYHPLWHAVGAQPVIDLAASKSSDESSDDRLYVLDVDGVQVLDAASGALLSQHSFEHPTQPTAIAVDAAGIAYVADTVCRCVITLSPNGRWDTVGSFGGGAPFSLAVAPDGTIYAADRADSGYQLRIIDSPRSRTVALNFNAAAPPLVASDGSGQVWVVEWLASLIDGSTSGAVSHLSATGAAGQGAPMPAFDFWLEGLNPETVSSVKLAPGGDLAFATADQGVLLVDSSGTVVDQIALEAAPRRIAFGDDGTLYTADAVGGLAALSTGGQPDRFGGRALALGVPVLGTLAEAAPQQSWTYAGTAGERLTISAVDQSRPDVFALGLDMALRLLAPDGTELATNDDQLGDDLFGVYDAQIADVVLPQTGTYTVQVDWKQGQGMYTLGVSAPQSVELSADGVTRLSGRLQDVFPSQRWEFSGRAGDVLTLTMTGDTSLDPALVLRQSDGELVAFNDDAADPELGVNAQITQVTLPADGEYSVEASRFEGAGEYSLVIVNTG